MKALFVWVDRLIERTSTWVVRRALAGNESLFSGSGVVHGEGYILHKATGERTPFRMFGAPSDEAIREAARLVARTLYGPLAGGPFSRMRGAVTHPVAVCQALCDLVCDTLDSGHLVFMTSGDAEVATLTLNAAAFGAGSAASPSVATAGAITSDEDATGGTIAKFKLETSGAVAKVYGAVGTSGSDINLSSLTVSLHDTVAVSSLTYSSPP